MNKTVISYLKNTVKQYSDKVCCIDDNETITYRELDELSDAVAYKLSSIVKRSTPVPLIMKKSCKALILMWGIIKSGCCYVVIDGNQPNVRIESILNTLNASLVICENDITKKVPSYDGQMLKYEDFIKLDTSLVEENESIKDKVSFGNDIIDTDPLYVMFTSGSTGTPKGVLVSHRNVVDFIDIFTELFEFDSEDIIGNQAPWDFDVSVKDIFSSIKVGATLRLIPKKYFSLPMDLAKLLDEDKVTTLTWAVSALVILSSRGILEEYTPKHIKKVIFSGEVMPAKQYNIWRKCYPNAKFINIYGPTEITCNCTYYEVKGLYGEEDVIPMGKAIPNERVFLLDDEDRLITEDMISVPGEVCVSGTAVTMGYFNNPEETAKRFVQNPLNKMYEEKIYRTGDLAYYIDTGDLCFSSRKDFQIKHMGHRIELSEIERCINSFEGIHMSCCLYENEEITAFIEGDAEEKALIMYMRKTLPVFMIPARFVFVESMPFNNNGKIDRKALKEKLQ
ncbi:MAG: amino acid adenylation domain-containing protein [Lachnospiraceae bacterium]|nr:amino acid adenylation domain-containing protein [Lachnospiraceae bacterium]